MSENITVVGNIKIKPELEEDFIKYKLCNFINEEDANWMTYYKKEHILNINWDSEQNSNFYDDVKEFLNNLNDYVDGTAIINVYDFDHYSPYKSNIILAKTSKEKRLEEIKIKESEILDEINSLKYLCENNNELYKSIIQKILLETV